QAAEGVVLAADDPNTYESCVERCDRFAAWASGVCTTVATLRNPVWTTRCAAAAAAGYAICRASCPPRTTPYEFVWCTRYAVDAFPVMNGRPDHCGKSPGPLLVMGCHDISSIAYPLN